MADKKTTEDIQIPGSSRDLVFQIRTMLSRAVRVRRTQEGGDLMPYVRIINKYVVMNSCKETL